MDARTWQCGGQPVPPRSVRLWVKRAGKIVAFPTSYVCARGAATAWWLPCTSRWGPEACAGSRSSFQCFPGVPGCHGWFRSQTFSSSLRAGPRSWGPCDAPGDGACREPAAAPRHKHESCSCRIVLEDGRNLGIPWEVG